MIEKNLGNIERVLRLSFGVLFLVWAMSQPVLNGIEWFIVAIAAALILNGVFSRCYLWYVLELNSCDPSEPGCKTQADCV